MDDEMAARIYVGPRHTDFLAYYDSQKFRSYRYGAGFYLWFAALFCATIGILLGKDWLKKQKKKTTA